MRRLMWIVPAMAAIIGVGAVAPSPATAGDDEQRTIIRLTGPAIGGILPKGKAVFRVRPSRNRTKFKVQVEQVNLPNGTMLNVEVDDTSYGSIALALQRGELELSSNDGEVVPPIAAGSHVAVRLQDGTLILSGNFP